jgi:hypothetical protein
MYQFYVKLDGQQFGPYTATQIVNMELPGDTEVMEASIGSWEKANDYPWSDLVLKETGSAISPSGGIVSGSSANVSSVRQSTGNSNTVDQPSIGLGVLSFLVPIIGWILYFVHRDESPVKAKACSKWAWIGFGVNFVLYLIALGAS